MSDCEKGTPVLVTTLHKGVFFGRVVQFLDGGRTVILSGAKCAIAWRTTKGVWELAQDGPNQNSKIGSEAPELKLFDVTAVARCTSKAISAWDNS